MRVYLQLCAGGWVGANGAEVGRLCVWLWLHVTEATDEVKNTAFNVSTYRFIESSSTRVTLTARPRDGLAVLGGLRLRVPTVVAVVGGGGGGGRAYHTISTV